MGTWPRDPKPDPTPPMKPVPTKTPDNDKRTEPPKGK